ncbi:MAG: DUF5337 domain-containing protein [Pseudomonadota bacterium]
MSKQPSQEDVRRAETSRLVSIVLVLAMALWLGVQWLGPRMGLPGEYAILADLFALAAFTWSMIVALRLWRSRS